MRTMTEEIAMYTALLGILLLLFSIALRRDRPTRALIARHKGCLNGRCLRRLLSQP